MLSITPPPERRIAGITALIPRNAPVKPVSMIVCHCSSVWLSKPTLKFAPALLQRISTEQKVSSVNVIVSNHWSGFLTSRSPAIALPSAATISSTTFCAILRLKSATHTHAPSLANNFACAPPIAPPPPVMIAVLPSNLIATSNMEIIQ